MKGTRKLKPTTRIGILRRDLRIARSMLEVAASKFVTFAREIDQNGEIERPRRDDLASGMREMSSECARIAGVCNGW